jgi:hypothetical protein
MMRRRFLFPVLLVAAVVAFSGAPSRFAATADLALRLDDRPVTIMRR